MKHFPNGFTSWVETHHEIVSMVERMRHSDNVPKFLSEIQEKYGTGGFYELCEYMTDSFENLNEGREWDGEFFDELEDFVLRGIGE